MTLSVGCIVLFHDKADQVREVDWPAIVLAVDLTDDGPALRLGVFSDLGYGYIAGVREGFQVGQWSWPVLMVADNMRLPR